MVNRVWQHHFGRGLVGTPSNFGTLGEPPTHPELLDHLADRFIADGWSFKELHREIMLSAAYQLGSTTDARERREVDPDNRLLWRMNRRRLEVEAWRDAHAGRLGQARQHAGRRRPDLARQNNRRRTLYGYAPLSSATGVCSVAVIVVLSPGITISTPSGNFSDPVTSVVRM